MEVWVDPRLDVRSSAIGGRGLFASTDISAACIVVKLGGRLVSSAELRARFDQAGARGIGT